MSLPDSCSARRPARSDNRHSIRPSCHYELWHMPSGNLVNTFDRETEAMAVVHRTFEQDGRDAGELFALGTEDRRGRSRQVAAGADLLARALASDSSDAARMV